MQSNEKFPRQPGRPVCYDSIHGAMRALLLAEEELVWVAGPRKGGFWRLRCAVCVILAFWLGSGAVLASAFLALLRMGGQRIATVLFLVMACAFMGMACYFLSILIRLAGVENFILYAITNRRALALIMRGGIIRAQSFGPHQLAAARLTPRGDGAFFAPLAAPALLNATIPCIGGLVSRKYDMAPGFFAIDDPTAALEKISLLVGRPAGIVGSAAAAPTPNDSEDGFIAPSIEIEDKNTKAEALSAVRTWVGSGEQILWMSNPKPPWCRRAYVWRQWQSIHPLYIGAAFVALALILMRLRTGPISSASCVILILVAPIFFLTAVLNWASIARKVRLLPFRVYAVTDKRAFAALSGAGSLRIKELGCAKPYEFTLVMDLDGSGEMIFRNVLSGVGPGRPWGNDDALLPTSLDNPEMYSDLPPGFIGIDDVLVVVQIVTDVCWRIREGDIHH